ncbi:MAG TPA: 2-amino-4-hydroxy-6-hydroxymethyldihydropteridine diphosphokinase [Bryobacteraceae bacterium]|nr:2-amino-4-hydroxy-6-hydroxymethyldihydropteridine diphosphokinase [Bryobacteraceae bacterium]
MKTAYLSLGSNLGDREAQLRAAIERLNASGIRVIRASSIYETEPQDMIEQPWFLNMALEIETDLLPLQLLSQIQQIEKEMGRQREVPKGPRTIDIDMLFYGDEVVTASALLIPHPSLGLRRFVLEPLAELAPNLRHPVLGRTIAEMLPATAAQRVRRWNG